MILISLSLSVFKTLKFDDKKFYLQANNSRFYFLSVSKSQWTSGLKGAHRVKPSRQKMKEAKKKAKEIERLSHSLATAQHSIEIAISLKNFAPRAHRREREKPILEDCHLTRHTSSCLESLSHGVYAENRKLPARCSAPRSLVYSAHNTCPWASIHCKKQR